MQLNSIGRVLMQKWPWAGTQDCKHEIEFRIKQCCHLARIGFGEGVGASARLLTKLNRPACMVLSLLVFRTPEKIALCTSTCTSRLTLDRREYFTSSRNASSASRHSTAYIICKRLQDTSGPRGTSGRGLLISRATSDYTLRLKILG